MKGIKDKPKQLRYPLLSVFLILEDGLPFQIMLITTYPNQVQFDKREDYFQELIKEKGPLKLLNEKKPADFRKTFFSTEMVRHWN